MKQFALAVLILGLAGCSHWSKNELIVPHESRPPVTIKAKYGTTFFRLNGGSISLYADGNKIDSDSFGPFGWKSLTQGETNGRTVQAYCRQRGFPINLTLGLLIGLPIGDTYSVRCRVTVDGAGAGDLEF